jgi:Xaa-Pro dipeptidase
MDSLNEIQEKERRVRDLLNRLGYDAVLLTRRENFAWMSCGGRAVTSNVDHSSPVYLLVTMEKKYAIGLNMDIPRIRDEEIAGQGFEFVSLPTFGKSPLQFAQELAKGKLAVDDSLPGLDNIEAHILSIHEPFTPQEIERYRLVAGESAAIIRELADWIEPGMSERHVLAHMWALYLEHDFDGDCMFVVSDDRIGQYRHAIPGYKNIEKVVILAPAVFKKGLHVQISRMVSFGVPPPETQRRFHDMAFLQAVMVANTKPGVKLKDLLNLCLDYYDKLGYPAEKTNHVHGGPTGYKVSYPERCLDPLELVHPHMAFTWYLTVTGAKTEETYIVSNKGQEIISVSKNWPALNFDVEGKNIAIPDLLVRG